MNFFQYDFGYEWPWTLGHAIAAVACAVIAILAWRVRTPRWIPILTGLVALWAIGGAIFIHGPFGLSRPLTLPTDAFLPSGGGRVLDGGAGSGRATLMVLLARPQSTVTAIDIFSEGFGIQGNTPDRLRDNAARAGVANRLDVVTADLRKLPFAPASFDAAVSAYVVDHLNRDGMARSLSEIARVLRPEGQFLLMVIVPDKYVRFTFPFLVAHGYFGPRTPSEAWRTRLKTAGFTVQEEGTRPGTLYFLCKTGPTS
jgi:SAM-dependent methyltransferase